MKFAVKMMFECALLSLEPIKTTPAGLYVWSRFMLKTLEGGVDGLMSTATTITLMKLNRSTDFITSAWIVNLDSEKKMKKKSQNIPQGRGRAGPRPVWTERPWLQLEWTMTLILKKKSHLGSLATSSMLLPLVSLFVKCSFRSGKYIQFVEHWNEHHWCIGCTDTSNDLHDNKKEVLRAEETSQLRDYKKIVRPCRDIWISWDGPFCLVQPLKRENVTKISSGGLQEQERKTTAKHIGLKIIEATRDKVFFPPSISFGSTNALSVSNRTLCLKPVINQKLVRQNPRLKIPYFQPDRFPKTILQS